jgi:hypothetical protein
MEIINAAALALSQTARVENRDGNATMTEKPQDG